MAEKWLLTGGTGQVGLALQRLAPAGVEIVAPGRSEFDLEQLSRPISEDVNDSVLPREGGGLRPVTRGIVSPHEAPAFAGEQGREVLGSQIFQGITAIINCGAYTAVDKAESEPELAHAINAAAPGALARAAARMGIPIIHVSTDYVFAADGAGPWSEGAAIAPASVYGRTKADGEAAVQASGARYAIIRTAWVVSADGSNFIKTMLRLGAERDALRVVSDQRGTPTHAGDLAAALAQIAARFAEDPAQASGIWHCANAGETTWYGLATRVFASAASHGLKVPTTVEAITTAEYPTPAKRPADSRLDCSKIAIDFGIRLRPWQEAVDEVVGQLAKQGLAK